MKLLIAVPTYDTMRAEFVRSLMDLTARLNRENIPHEVKIETGTLVYMARDHLARYAVNNGFTDVLWLDSDMVFGDGILDDLTMHGKDFVCGLFISRHEPYMSCVFSRLLPPERVLPADFRPIEGCGMACTYMKAKVLEDVMNHNEGKCFLPTQVLSEDLAFCQRARACGYDLWCEPSARVGHVGTLTIWPEDGGRMREQVERLEEMRIV